MPLRIDDLLYPNYEQNQLHARTVPTTYARTSQTDHEDDDIQPPASASLSHSRLKGKQPERDSNSDVVMTRSGASADDHQRLHSESSPASTDEKFPSTSHLSFDSGQQARHVAGASLTPWNYVKSTTVMANDEPSISVASRPTVISSDNCLMSWSLNRAPLDGAASPDESLSSLPLSHYIERSPPLLWAPLSLTVSYTPPLFCDSPNPRLHSPEDEPVTGHELTPQLDYTSDSSSDTSVSTTCSAYGWVDSEPSYPLRALAMPQDDLPSFPTIDNSDIPLLYDLSSDANIEFPGESRLESTQASLKTKGVVTTHYKRKRLFLMEEDEYGERAHKQRCIEQ